MALAAEEAEAAESEAAAAAARAAARAAALAAVRRLGGPRLRLVAVGGAVVPQAQLAFLREVFGGAGCAVSNGWRDERGGGTDSRWLTDW